MIERIGSAENRFDHGSRMPFHSLFRSRTRPRVRRITLANRANLLNASVRIVHQEDNYLTYAPRDMFAVVLYLRAKQTYDPGRVLTNTFYNKYAPLILAQ